MKLHQRATMRAEPQAGWRARWQCPLAFLRARPFVSSRPAARGGGRVGSIRRGRFHARARKSPALAGRGETKD